ncbi:MAG: T9SS type A sorting domain-containing protein [Robiginitalea sp.]|uniref:T9SS type A sorting domain-containing protein n=1 Tax=Robiginitalea sp. TaxID=1902411 RepID=UPI003C72943C
MILNGQRYQTRASSITLNLDQPVNQLEVRTDLDCQGVYTQSITLTEEPIALPNPIDSGDLRVFVPAEDGAKVRIRMFSMTGSSLLNKEVVIDKGEVKINMDGYARGVYLLNVTHQEQLYSYKIIKR